LPRLFCFGLGYSAMALARRLKAEGWRIAGTARGQTALAVLIRNRPRRTGVEQSPTAARV